MINIAMNNAFILYDQRPHPRIQESYTSKGDFLTEVAHRMCRPWAVEKYRSLGNRFPNSRLMLNSTFHLINEERGYLLQPPPAEAPAPSAQAPAAQAPPPPAAIGGQAALPHWLPIVVPQAVPGAVRDEIPNYHPLPTEIPFLGGRWSGNIRRRYTLPYHSNFFY